MAGDDLFDKWGNIFVDWGYLYILGSRGRAIWYNPSVVLGLDSRMQIRRCCHLFICFIIPFQVP